MVAPPINAVAGGNRRAKQVSVAGDQIDKPVPASAVSTPLLPASRPGALGPQSLDANRDAWANALNTMSGVYTPDPLTAGAKVLGMGLAGYGQGKATRQKEAGTSAYRARLAEALSGKPDNATLMGLAFDPYADESSQRMAWNMWERNNPTEDQLLERQIKQKTLENADRPNYTKEKDIDGNLWWVPDRPGFEPVPITNFDAYQDPKKPNIVTVELGKNRKVQFDLSIPEHRERYYQIIEQQQLAPQGTAQAGEGEVEDPMKIRSDLLDDPQWRMTREVASTLNSMFASFTDKSAISDLDFIIGTAKIMDPSSIVRTQEGEQVKATQSIPSALAGRMNQILSGKAELDDKTRMDLYDLASRRGFALFEQAEAQRAETERMMKHNNFDPDIYLPGQIQMPRNDWRRLENQNMQRPPEAGGGGLGGLWDQMMGQPEQPPPQAAPAPAPAPSRQLPPQQGPGPAPAAPAPPQAAPAPQGRGLLQLSPEQAQLLPPGLLEHVEERIMQSSNPELAIQTFTELLGDPDFEADLRRLFPQFYSGDPRGGGGGGGW